MKNTYYVYGRTIHQSEDLIECIDKFNTHTPFKNIGFDYTALGVNYVGENNFPCAVDVIIKKNDKVFISKDFIKSDFKDTDLINNMIEEFNRKYNLNLSL